MVSGTEKAAGKREESKSCKIISDKQKSPFPELLFPETAVLYLYTITSLILDGLNPHGNVKALDRVGECTERDNIHASFCNRADIVFGDIAGGFQ